MPPVFAHGRLRLYLLKLLDEAPRHGYEVIRLLEERFQGLYAPSAGTVYPRLAKLEAEGLVRHATEGGRKVYSITEAGRAELAAREGELAALELEIRESVSELAAEGWEAHNGDRESRRLAKDELRRAKEQWKEQARRAKEQARRAKDESRRARQDAQQAWKHAQDAQAYAREEVQRIAHQVQEQVQSHARAGDWQGALREGMAEIARSMGSWGAMNARTTAWPPYVKPDAAQAPVPEWAEEEAAPSGDPARDLERLLDRFRDDIRDTAHDRGVSPEQLREIRRHLSTAAAHIGVLLRPPAP